MACCLFGAKPLSKPILGCCQLDDIHRQRCFVNFGVTSISKLYASVQPRHPWYICSTFLQNTHNRHPILRPPVRSVEFLIVILKSVYALHLQHCKMKSRHGNVFCVTVPLWWESKGHRCIPITKGQLRGALMLGRTNCWANTGRWSGTPWCSCGFSLMVCISLVSILMDFNVRKKCGAHGNCSWTVDLVIVTAMENVDHDSSLMLVITLWFDDVIW